MQSFAKINLRFFIILIIITQYRTLINNKLYMKKSLYAIAWVSLTAINSANAAINPGTVTNQGIVTQGRADEVVQRYVQNTLAFLYLIAVLYGLWGGFNILTASGDEEKVKKGKTIIINALIWIVVIFLVGTIVEFLINAILV